MLGRASVDAVERGRDVECHRRLEGPSLRVVEDGGWWRKEGRKQIVEVRLGETGELNMILRRIVAGLVLAVPVVIAGASAADAGPPLTTEGSEEGDLFLTDCGDFDLHDHFTFESHGKVFLDEAGNPARVVEQVAGTDTFYNSVTDRSVTGTINSGEIVDLVNGTVTQNGTLGRITVPGMGVVFFDVGKYIVDFDEGLVFLAGSHHAFFEEDYAPLCELLS